MKGVAMKRKYTDVIISRSPPSWSHTARRPPSPPSWPPSPPPPPPLHWRSSSSEGGQGKQLLGGINFKAVIICDSYATVDFVISRTSPPPPLKWSSLKRKKLVRKSFKLDLVLKPHPVDFDFFDGFLHLELSSERTSFWSRLHLLQIQIQISFGPCLDFCESCLYSWH